MCLAGVLRSRLVQAALFFASAACVASVPAYVTLPPPQETSGVIVTVDRTIRAPYGFVAFTGTVHNETDRDLASCRITIEVLDHEMSPAGRARVTVVDLLAGETRGYRAELQKILKTVRTVPMPEVRLKWAEGTDR